MAPTTGRDDVPADRPAPGLSVRGARVVLGDAQVLHGVDLDVAAGTVLALLGPSGCGKTTLLRAVAGLQGLAGGTVAIDGDDVTRVPAERRGVGLVFQDGALFPHMSVGANVGFGLDRRARRGTAVEEALAMVGLAGFGDRMPATLSGGQQQRVALARTLAARPRVLLLDEPFSSLDAALRSQVRAEVAELLRDLPITTIVVTHDQEEAFLLGDEVAVMIDGRIHQQAAPAEVYAAPASRAVADFLGDVNVVRGVATGRRARTWLGDVPLDTDLHGDVEVLVRPEHLRMTADGGVPVEAIEFFGHDAVTRLVGPEGDLRVRTLALPPFRRGDHVEVSFAGPPARAFSATSPHA